jgi:hypothetical protein
VKAGDQNAGLALQCQSQSGPWPFLTPVESDVASEGAGRRRMKRELTDKSIETIDACIAFLIENGEKPSRQ